MRTGDTQAPRQKSLEPRRAPGRADPTLAGDRLVDHPENGRVAVQQGDERAEGRPPCDEGPRSVDRVQHPAQAGLRPVQPELLAKDAVIGEAAGQDRPHRLLGGTVRNGHGTEVPFRLRGQAAPKKGADHCPRDIGRSLGRDQQSIQRGRAQFRVSPDSGSRQCDPAAGVGEPAPTLAPCGIVGVVEFARCSVGVCVCAAPSADAPVLAAGTLGAFAPGPVPC